MSLLSHNHGFPSRWESHELTAGRLTLNSNKKPPCRSRRATCPRYLVRDVMLDAYPVSRYMLRGTLGTELICSFPGRIRRNAPKPSPFSPFWELVVLRRLVSSAHICNPQMFSLSSVRSTRRLTPLTKHTCSVTLQLHFSCPTSFSVKSATDRLLEPHLPWHLRNPAINRMRPLASKLFLASEALLGCGGGESEHNFNHRVP